MPFPRFDVEIRKIVCTTYAIESVNARIRKAVRVRGHFPTGQAALKRVYLAVMSLDPTTARLRSALAATAAQWFRDRTLALDLALDGRSEPSTLPSTAGSPPGDAEEIRPTSAVHCTDLVQAREFAKTEGHSAATRGSVASHVGDGPGVAAKPLSRPLLVQPQKVP